MVAVLAADDDSPSVVAARRVILPRHFHGGLVGFGPARNEIGTSVRLTEAPCEQACQRFLRLVAEKRRVCERELVELPSDCSEHFRVRVSEAGNGSAAARIQVLVTVGIFDRHAGGANGNGILRARRSIEDV